MLRLTQALRLDNLPRLALVGAGGKTAALFSLGRELLLPGPKTRPQGTMTGARVNLYALAEGHRAHNRRVFLTATTHLATGQLRLADRHYILQSETDLDALPAALPDGALLFTGQPGEDGRTTGLPDRLVDLLHQLADQLQAPLIVEADGSRQLPLKAPAAHEPAIPGWVDSVVIVAGLSGLGKPLNKQWVHRPELFARLAKMDLEAVVSGDDLVRVLCHPQGGLKAIPPDARRVVLLNQAGTAERQALAQRLARPLLEHFASVVVADLPPLDAPTSEGNRPGGVIAVHERTGGIILAAGAASRMGRPKQTLIWQGLPLVRHVAQAALEAGLDPVVVVTGSAADLVQAAVDGLPVQVVNNPGWQAGQSSSVIKGLGALPVQAGAAVFLLADQPRTPANLIQSLVEAHASTLSPLVAPLVQGQRANPVLFDRLTFPDFLSLSGDQGGRALFSRYPLQWVPWHDPAILQDIDTPEDYQELIDN